MRIKSAARTIAATLAFSSTVVHAQQAQDRPLSYDYVHAALTATELDTGGFEGGGSFTIGPNIHVFASYQDWEFNRNVDRSTLQVGAGYHWDISSNLDLVLAVAYADSELDPPGAGKIDDSGLILSAGLRGWLTSAVETSATLLLDDSLGSNVNSVVELGGEYYLSDQLSLGGRVRIDEDDVALFLGGRFHFGRRDQR